MPEVSHEGRATYAVFIAGVLLVKMGANGAIDTTTATAPVEVFILTNAGLMADVSLQGTKVSRLKI